MRASLSKLHLLKSLMLNESKKLYGRYRIKLMVRRHSDKKKTHFVVISNTTLNFVFEYNYCNSF